jgi:hypothetical protein
MTVVAIVAGRVRMVPPLSMRDVAASSRGAEDRVDCRSSALGMDIRRIAGRPSNGGRSIRAAGRA